MSEKPRSRLKESGLAIWIATDPLKAMVVVCVACVAVALAVGVWAPSRFLQNAAADFVGGVVAALVIFGIAEVAFGFSQTRKRQREAVVIALRVVGVELSDNREELRRFVRVLGERKLSRDDPMVQRESHLQMENWRLFIQSPVIAHLPSHLVWRIHEAYYYPVRTQRELQRRVASAALNPQAWLDLGQQFLPKFEAHLTIVDGVLHSLEDDALSKNHA